MSDFRVCSFPDDSASDESDESYVQKNIALESLLKRLKSRRGIFYSLELQRYKAILSARSKKNSPYVSSDVVLYAYDRGATVTEIAQQLNVPKNLVSKILRRYYSKPRDTRIQRADIRSIKKLRNKFERELNVFYQWAPDVRTKSYVYGDRTYTLLQCYYCDDYASGRDHTYPLALLFRDIITREFTLEMLPRLIIVPACKTCNILLGVRVFSTLEERKAYITQKRKRRITHRI